MRTCNRPEDRSLFEQEFGMLLSKTCQDGKKPIDPSMRPSQSVVPLQERGDAIERLARAHTPTPTPAHNGTETSEQAAGFVRKSLTRTQQLVFEVIRNAGEMGVTRAEICRSETCLEAKIEIPSVCGRTNELLKLRRIQLKLDANGKPVVRGEGKIKQHVLIVKTPVQGVE